MDEIVYDVKIIKKLFSWQKEGDEGYEEWYLVEPEGGFPKEWPPFIKIRFNGEIHTAANSSIERDIERKFVGYRNQKAEIKERTELWLKDLVAEFLSHKPRFSYEYINHEEDEDGEIYNNTVSVWNDDFFALVNRIEDILYRKAKDAYEDTMIDTSNFRHLVTKYVEGLDGEVPSNTFEYYSSSLC